jgi:TatD DNase family protein
MILIDSHSHIYLDEFDHDRDEVIERAGSAGVTTILMPAIDSGTHQQMLSIESTYPKTCRSMMGLHPCSVKENYLEELEIVERLLKNQTFIAVGEIGLDFYWDVNFKDQQYEAFHRQLEWAVLYNIPVSIHSRNATDECIEVINQHQDGNLRGVFHCFSGTPAQAQRLIDLGFYLGIGGVLTFKNAGLDKVIREIDLSNIVLETDAPYLAPVPFRGKRNEPSYLSFVAQKLADIKAITVGQVAEMTTANSKKLFGL